MSDEKLKYLAGIFLVVIVIGVAVGGVILLKPKTGISPPPETPKIISPQEFSGIVKSLGGEEEFSLEKEGEIVFQNKAGDEPKIRYRISYPGKMVLGRWKDLKLEDKAVLTISYGPTGQIESRVLRVYREQASTEQ